MRLIKKTRLEITRDELSGFWDEKGRWVERGSVNTFNIQCSLQPFKESITQTVLPEGVTSDQALLVYTKTPLQTSEQIDEKLIADTTIIDGFVYEAFFDENWDRDYGLRVNHRKITFIRRDQDTGGSI